MLALRRLLPDSSRERVSRSSSSPHVIYLNLPGSRHIAGGARLDHDAGNAIRHVVVRAGWMIDGVSAAPGRSALQAHELTEQPRMIEKVALLRIYDREEVAVDIRLRFI